MVVIQAVMVVIEMVMLVIEMAKAVSFALLFVYLGDGTSGGGGKCGARFGDGQGVGILLSQGFGDQWAGGGD